MGSVYISTNATNPSNYIGGTWESYGQGRTLIGAGTSDRTFTAGQTGGESNHKLTVAEMPSHMHNFSSGGSALTVGGTIDSPSIPKAYGYVYGNGTGWWTRYQ